MKIVASKKNIT